jgi:N-acetyl-anhydromuramoyl-L-alanine amidase
MKREASHLTPHASLVTPDGLLNGARYVPSPNCDDRPPDARIELIVIHSISLPPGEFGGAGVTQLFTNTLDPAEHPYYETIKDLRVSAHFFIRREGEIIQFVPCTKRAWHAGASSWRDRQKCNDFSIGIELEGSDDTPFTAAQYEALTRLTTALRGAFPIADIVGHADIAPGRKTDPGAHFDWQRYFALLSSGRSKAS